MPVRDPKLCDVRELVEKSSTILTHLNFLMKACQIRPKFKDHKYCGKTCASKAASLCSVSQAGFLLHRVRLVRILIRPQYCQQNPKFSGHEFCSKTCAVQARVKQQQQQQQQYIHHQQVLAMMSPSVIPSGPNSAYGAPPVPAKEAPAKDNISSRILHARK